MEEGPENTKEKIRRCSTIELVFFFHSIDRVLEKTSKCLKKELTE